MDTARPPSLTAPLSPYCLAADEGLAGPKAHGRCAASGPRTLPGLPAGTPPVLPVAPCGCDCHAGARR